MKESRQRLEQRWAEAIKTLCPLIEADLQELQRLVAKTQNPETTEGPMPMLYGWYNARDTAKLLQLITNDPASMLRRLKEQLTGHDHPCFSCGDPNGRECDCDK